MTQSEMEEAIGLNTQAVMTLMHRSRALELLAGNLLRLLSRHAPDEARLIVSSVRHSFAQEIAEQTNPLHIQPQADALDLLNELRAAVGQP